MTHHKLPEGYTLALSAHYPVRLHDRHSVQLLNTETCDMPRGVGLNFAEALKHAISNAGGDDGLSAAFRTALQGPRQWPLPFKSHRLPKECLRRA